MDGGGHYIAAVQHILHHRLVQVGGVAALALVAVGELLIDGGQQRARAAGEVRHAQVADGGGVRPVNAVQLGDGELRQQRGGGGQRVEGGEILAVGD